MRLDHPQRFFKSTGLLEHAADLGEHGRRCVALGDQLFQLPAITFLQAFERQRPKHGWAAAQHVAAERELVEIVAPPILQVVQNLKRDAQVPGQLCDCGLRTVRPGPASRTPQ